MKIDNRGTTRRMALKVGVGAIGAGFVGFAGRHAVAQEKLAQTVVQYQETPKDGALCSKCVNFQAPDACTIVAGKINPNGWCVAFAPKDG